MDDVGVAAVAGAVIGLLLGLIPLIYGLNKGEKSLAWGGFAACIVGGAILGLFLAIPAAIVFTVLINRNVKNRQVQPGAYGAVPPGQQWGGQPGAQQWGGQPGAQQPGAQQWGGPQPGGQQAGGQPGAPPAGTPPPPPPPPQQQ